eukprot:3831051-Alexandrium_andersonii.AAC.1
MGGQPNGLVGSAAWNLPPFPEVALQPGREDINGRPPLCDSLPQPPLDLQPRGPGSREEGRRPPPAPVALDDCSNSRRHRDRAARPTVHAE